MEFPSETSPDRVFGGRPKEGQNHTDPGLKSSSDDKESDKDNEIRSFGSARSHFSYREPLSHCSSVLLHAGTPS